MPPDTPIRPRQLQSCLGCRGIKVRCVGNEDQSVQCQRCSVPCVYSSQRRGRKTNVERAARDSTSVQPNPEDKITQASDIVYAPLDASMAPVEPAPSHTTNSLASISPSAALQNVTFQLQASAGSAAGVFTSTPASVTSLPAAAPRLDVSEYLDPPLPAAMGIFDTHEDHISMPPPDMIPDARQFDDPSESLHMIAVANQ
uniref:Zn(2)-C6 fungal-type domain-containing protein n=1 Tax=Kwoniella bestiolae CBS 10118 TaxID=1296100 RepID=A0A1B9GBV4_9TREE|nr:hypothetical protein I302_03363 [Kwoniella bestiolae CBS 10118]OCF28504.1 hypothetical protein I302_03363 [Kwoniella bestiolae CBS 10118]